jgi:hypothetical protein
VIGLAGFNRRSYAGELTFYQGVSSFFLEVVRYCYQFCVSVGRSKFMPPREDLPS